MPSDPRGLIQAPGFERSEMLTSGYVITPIGKDGEASGVVGLSQVSFGALQDHIEGRGFIEACRSPPFEPQSPTWHCGVCSGSDAAHLIVASQVFRHQGGGQRAHLPDQEPVCPASQSPRGRGE